MRMNCKLSRVAEDYCQKNQKIICNAKGEFQNLRVTPSISMNFLNQMNIQCCTLIELCKNILRFTTCLQTQTLAEELKCSCENFVKQIEEMKEDEHCMRARNQRQEVYCYQNNFEDIIEKMFCRLENMSASNDINKDFREIVSIVCESILCMCDNVLKFRLLPEVRDLAEDIHRCIEKIL